MFLAVLVCRNKNVIMSRLKMPAIKYRKRLTHLFISFYYRKTIPYFMRDIQGVLKTKRNLDEEYIPQHIIFFIQLCRTHPGFLWNPPGYTQWHGKYIGTNI
jgi:hypothetical protein